MATAIVDLELFASTIRESVADYRNGDTTDEARAEIADFWAKHNIPNQFAALLAASKAVEINRQLKDASEAHNSGKVPTAAARRKVALLVKEKIQFSANYNI